MTKYLIFKRGVYFGLLLQRFQYIVFLLCCFWACGEAKHPGGRKGWGQNIVVAGTRARGMNLPVLTGFFPFSFQITPSFVLETLMATSRTC